MTARRPKLRRPLSPDRTATFCIEAHAWIPGVTLVALGAREALDQIAWMRLGGFDVGRVSTIDGASVTLFELQLLAVDSPILPWGQAGAAAAP